MTASTLACLLRSAILVFAAWMCVVSPGAAREISFADLTWNVASGLLDDPADPNRFSDDVRSVWVDTAGRLHMRLRRDGERWIAAEVACTQQLGYGTYSFAVATDVAALDPNVVAGLFTWSDADSFAHREIDVEFSRWGDSAAADAQFAVQPYAEPGHLVRFNVPRGVRRSWYSIQWEPGVVTFAGYASALLRAGVPPPGNARVHINLWLAGARAPIDGRETELIIDKFVFGPPTATSAKGIDSPAPQASP